MKMRLSLGVFGCVLLALVLSACGGDDGKGKTYVVGAVMPNPTSVEAWDAFKATMAERGYVEGKNTTYFNETNISQLFEVVSADKLDLIYVIGATFGQKSVTDLVGATPVKQHNIPVIFAPVSGDPVATGDVESLSHPGANFTGIVMDNADDKRFELFADMLADRMGPIAVVYNPDDVDAVTALSQIEEVAQLAGIELISYATPIDQLSVTEQALATISAETRGLFLLKIWGTSISWYEWAYQHGVPTSQDGYLTAPIPEPLMTYGPSMAGMGTDAARLADQILKGIAPGDLPFEIAESILSIDLALSEAIGFEVPDDTLGIAQEIRRSDMAVYAGLSVPMPAGVIAHPSGTGACAATMSAMGTSYTVCVTVTCDELADESVMTFTDKMDVAECISEQRVGTCSRPTYDMIYYSGEVGMVAIGCGFLQGEWSTPE